MDELAVKILGGVLRAGIAAGGGYLVQKGLLDGSMVTTALGASAAMAATIWSAVQKLIAHATLKAAVAAPAK